MKKILSCLALIASLSIGTGKAATPDLDMSDMWWNPNESGWGLTLIQQGDVLFVTIYVYGADGRATWFGAPNVSYIGNTPDGPSFTGPLYQLSGPAYTGSYNSNIISGRSVGEVTVNSTGTSSATLMYTVDGIRVSKLIERQTWRTKQLSANYAGAEISTTSCLTSGPFSTDNSQSTKFAISNTTSTFSMTTTTNTDTCRYTGDYVQAGRFGRSSGTYTCGNNITGTYVASEIDATAVSISGRAKIKVGNCSYDNRFAGVKK